MEKLNYETLKKSGYKGYILEKAPEKVMQFGEGNFLRAFADYWFDISNEKAGWNGKIVLVQPIAQGLTDLINSQEGLYTLYLRGSQAGERVDRKRVISSVSRCLNPYTAEGFDSMMKLAVSDDLEYIVSNTTEAGIAYDPACKADDKPTSSFPGKLTQVLLARYNAKKSGLVILSCELIDNNGKELLKCVKQYAEQWKLPAGFVKYIEEDCLFCSTLVDRIVPGRIRDPKEAEKLEAENGYHDDLIDVGEVFGVWNIEGPESLSDKLPFKKAGVNCPVVPDVTPYKKRKVRILNGAHTGFVPGAYLAGFDIVRDCMHNDTIKGFMNKMLHEEIIPTLPLDKKDLTDFAEAVGDRFNNPFVNHELLSITLNSTSKWLARNYPSFEEYFEAKKELPKCLSMSFALLIAHYSSNITSLDDNGLLCSRPLGNTYYVKDDRPVLQFYYDRRTADDASLVHDVMTNKAFWGKDLTEIPGFEALTVKNLGFIRSQGALKAFESCL